MGIKIYLELIKGAENKGKNNEKEISPGVACGKLPAGVLC